MEEIKRNVAYKAWIATLLSGNYIKGAGQFESGYINVKDNKVSRVNLVGSIIDKYQWNNYLGVSLDDGSGVILLKSWNEDVNLFNGFEIGDLVLVVGKIKEYNNSIYVSPEIARKLDNPLWLKVRKLELIKEYGEVERVETVANINPGSSHEDDYVSNAIEEKVQSSSNNSTREILLSLIENLDSGMGADIDQVLEKSGLGDNGQKIIKDLIKEGEVFELQVGRLRVM